MSNYLNNQADILFRLICYTFVTCLVSLSLNYPQMLVDILRYFCAYLTLLGGLTKFETKIKWSGVADAVLILINSVFILQSVIQQTPHFALAYAIINECIVYVGHTNDGPLFRVMAVGAIIRPDYAWVLSSVLMLRDGLIRPASGSDPLDKVFSRLHVPGMHLSEGR